MMLLNTLVNSAHAKIVSFGTHATMAICVLD